LFQINESLNIPANGLAIKAKIVMKTVLLHIFEDRGLESRLQVALDIARAHEGHLSCLQPTSACQLPKYKCSDDGQSDL